MYSKNKYFGPLKQFFLQCSYRKASLASHDTPGRAFTKNAVLLFIFQFNMMLLQLEPAQLLISQKCFLSQPEISSYTNVKSL